MSTGQLCERYAELFGQPARTRHKAYLIRKIAWRLQSLDKGNLTERARRRAAELADVNQAEKFDATRVSLADAEMSLHLAMFAVEGLAGRVRVHMDARYRVDREEHAIVVDGSSRVGQIGARVFAGLLLRELGEDAFSAEPNRTETHARGCRRTSPAVGQRPNPED